MSDSREVATEEVTELELMQAAIAARETEMMRCFPAQVQSYSASKQTVDVVPALWKHLPDGAGNFVPEQLPKIADVPVCFPRCGEFFMSFPVKANDWVLIVCAQKNIGNWRSTGQSGDPGDLGMNTLDGAIAIPGVFPDSGALNNADGTNMVLGSDLGGNSRIELKPSGAGINLGAGATKGVNRTGDSTDMGTWTHVPASGIGVTACSLTYTPPGGGTPTVIGPSGAALSGKTKSGSSKVNAVD